MRWSFTPSSTLASPEGQAVNADTPSFVDLSKVQFLVVREDEVALPTGVAAGAQ